MREDLQHVSSDDEHGGAAGFVAHGRRQLVERVAQRRGGVETANLVEQSLGSRELGQPLGSVRLLHRRREVVGRGRTLGGNGVGQERRGRAFCFRTRRAGGVLTLVGRHFLEALHQPGDLPLQVVADAIGHSGHQFLDALIG